MNLKNLESKHLLYRPFEAADYDDLFAFLSLDEVCEYLPGDKAFNDVQVKKWLNYFIQTFDIEKPNMIYAVSTKNDPKVIGYVGLAYVVEFSKNEIMYAFHPEVWGKGYATEASHKMKEVAVSCGLKEVIALADINNGASERVLLKVGYRYVEDIEIWGLKMKYFELELNSIDNKS